MFQQINTLGRGAALALVAALVMGSQVSAHKALKTGEMRVSADGFALWQLPDKRALNPVIFGTPAAPLNVDLLPVAMRAVSSDGASYTTIKKPSMFSNNIKKISGSFNMSVQDLTAKDSMKSRDKISMVAKFTGPNGKAYRVVVKKVLPVGPDHPFYGGVGANVLMHGATGIGTPLVAQEFSYITAWGLGTLYIDGQKVDDKRIVHIMVSERMRDDNFKLGFGVANPDKLEIHLAMPPLKGSPKGPVASPVPSGLTLPNGKTQPFMHVNFYGDIKVLGNKFLASK